MKVERVLAVNPRVRQVRAELALRADPIVHDYVYVIYKSAWT